MKSFKNFILEVSRSHIGFINKSHELGYQAHKKGIMKAPSRDKEFHKHMGNFVRHIEKSKDYPQFGHKGDYKVGHPDSEHYDSVKHNIDAWHKGWEKADNE